ncbi:MAG: plastocyanin/azurin family copper-binding protein [Thermoanaerobaculia bacterium]
MRPALALITTLLVVFAAGCGKTEPASSEGARDTDTSATSRVGGLATGTRDIHLIEYQIHMETTLPPGVHTFSVENGGKEDHALEIEGNGIHVKTETIKRGDKAMLTVDLKPGTYTVYCPVEGHKGHGMQTTLTVK